jgi:hypothetical protein
MSHNELRSGDTSLREAHFTFARQRCKRAAQMGLALQTDLRLFYSFR